MHTLARPLAIAAVLCPAPAAASPAVLVGAAPTKIRSHRSHLVIAQDGARTTLSLQLDVLAVPMDMAIVLPIHGDVDPDSLEILDRRLFDRLDALAAPHLEHLWERDPCAPMPPATLGPPPAPPPTRPPHRPTVAHGEFDFAVLGRIGAGELETWLRGHGFPMADAHHAALAEHFTAGAQFVVARVDRRQVHFDARGHATLSPLRISFVPDPDWRLPLRAGLGHANGVTDVVIHGLTRDRRITLEDPPPALPDPIEVTPIAADRFAAVHAAVFAAARTRLALSEHAARLAPADLSPDELAALGLADPGDLVLSRIHLQYTPAELTDDPRLTVAPHPADLRSRYVVRHPWRAAPRCAHPQPGVWERGRPVDGADLDVDDAPRHVRAMSDARPVADLGPYLAADITELGLMKSPGGCDCATDASPRDVACTALLALALRRRRSPRV